MNNDLISRSELKKEIEKYRPKSTVKSLFLDGLNCRIPVDMCEKCKWSEDCDSRGKHDE